MKELHEIFMRFIKIVDTRRKASSKPMRDIIVCIGIYQTNVYDLLTGGWTRFYYFARDCSQQEIEELIRDMEAQMFEWSQP